MGTKGLIFDIKEFAVFDGPGIRTTVFFKGCPLRCNWCHNPEGLSFERQLMVSAASCTGCGKCGQVCPAHDCSSPPEKRIPAHCGLCGNCLGVCPLGLRRVAGEVYDAEGLAEKLLRNAAYLARTGGGFTVSGGEPTAQGGFLLELLERLRGNHRAIETCAFCNGDMFKAIMAELELVIMDIKLAAPEPHRRYTGQDNGPILANLERLKAGTVPFIIRIPLIPGITDTEANLRAIASLCAGNSPLIQVELLPYHKTAGAKYRMVGMEYQPAFNAGLPPDTETAYFSERGIPCSVL